MAAAAAFEEDGYATDWLDELRDVAGAAASLPPAARAALVAVLDTFAAEDGFLPRAVLQARLVLAGPVVERSEVIPTVSRRRYRTR